MTSVSDYSPSSAGKSKDAQDDSASISAFRTTPADVPDSPVDAPATTTITTPTSEPFPREEEGVLVFSALRRRERELPSRVAVLDDRMARARPGGLLEATVSASAVVSFSSTTIVGTSGDGRTRHGIAGGSNPGGGNTGGGNTGRDNTRDDNAWGDIGGGGGGGGGFGEAFGTATGTPDQIEHSGKRHRRRSVSLMPTAQDGSSERGVADGGACDGEANGGSRRRPWTTSRCDEAIAGENRDGERSDVTPFR